MKNTLLKTDEIGIFSLGGLGEVGKNMYIYEISNQIFIVDSGILFPDNHLLGIDYVIPDYQYLIDNQERIVGLFITHAHEDHIGGIPYLLKKVNIPKIYAAGIAVDMIEHKLNEHEDVKSPQIEVFKSHYKYNFKHTEMSFIRLNHSIPDMFGIVFRTKEGILFHTGDFKIDFTPVGPPAEYDKLAQIGSEGTLCMLSDSTNAEREGLIESDSKIGKSINELFSRIKGRIIIATFASNMYRIQQIIHSSILNKRKIAVFGRSMERAIEVGKQSGYIKIPKGFLISGEEINKIKDSDVTIIVTGSQGEPFAALSRIANGSHKQIKAHKGDTVIFSSSPIPGNQEGVNRTINKLFRLDVEVITHGPLADTHTSGHGSQNDLKLMLSLVKPKFFIPMHGEHRMLKYHRDLAVSCGVKPNNILIMDNGDVAAITKDSIRLAGHVQAGDIYIDGSGIGDIGSAVIRERKTLSEEGLFAIIITIDSSKKRLLSNPTIVSRGFIYMRGNEEITNELASIATKTAIAELNKKMFNELNMKQKIIDQLQSKIFEITMRKPVIIPIISDLSKTKETN
ncbi:ribonuclease J [Haploplasma axanthum]|uniref:Ribonuclease J n=1 Tax=Haploplasma axanthum TaxID=29552 RepID=A0A449BDG0_HAPAX|nr:ribonuclease J [Haploplasma axanthum]VEU80479.1 hydrolase [Haploplasma axanthum]